MSPELVLVDPELAAWARERLRERRDSPIHAGPAPAPHVTTRRAAEPELGAKRHRAAVAPPPALPIQRPRRLLIAAVVGLGVVAAAVLVVDSDAPGVSAPAGGRLAPALEDQPASPATAPSTEARPPAPSGSASRKPSTEARAPAPSGSASRKPSTEARPPAPSGSASRKAATIATPRRFAWAPRPGASGYHVELFKGRELVFRATTSTAEIVIPRRWRLNGRTHRLEPGSYRWYVWPRIAGRRGATATVQAKFVVPTR